MLRVARTGMITSPRASGERSARGASPEPGEGYRCYRIDQKLALLSPLTPSLALGTLSPLRGAREWSTARSPGTASKGRRRPFSNDIWQGSWSYRRGPLRSNGPFSVR
jgi:hypothetical protein